MLQTENNTDDWGINFSSWQAGAICALNFQYGKVFYDCYIYRQVFLKPPIMQNILSLVAICILWVGCQPKTVNDPLVTANKVLVLESSKSQLDELKLRYIIHPVRYTYVYKVALGLSNDLNEIQSILKDEQVVSEETMLKIDSMFLQMSRLRLHYLPPLLLNEMSENVRTYVSVGEKWTDVQKDLILTQLGHVLTLVTIDLSEGVKRKDLTYNRFTINIQENKEVLKKGETYTASIHISALDTTYLPEVKLQQDSPYTSYYSTDSGLVLQIPTQRSGNIHWRGHLEMPAWNGELIKVPIQDSFTVID